MTDLSCLEPTLAPDFIEKLLNCQHNEKVCKHEQNPNSALIWAPSRLFKIASLWCPKTVRPDPYPSYMPLISQYIGLNSFVEPNFLVYDVPTPLLEDAVKILKAALHVHDKDDDIGHRCRRARIERTRLMNEAIKHTVSTSPRKIICRT